MKITYKPTPNISVEIEARGIEEMFQTVGPIQEVLGGNCTCQKCKQSKIRMVHRKADNKFDVYELLCESCGARLSLGKNDMGNLFPRKYEQAKNSEGQWKPKLDGDGKKVWLPDGGWVKWDRTAGKYV